MKTKIYGKREEPWWKGERFRGWILLLIFVNGMQSIDFVKIVEKKSSVVCIFYWCFIFILWIWIRWCFWECNEK